MSDPSPGFEDRCEQAMAQLKKHPNQRVAVVARAPRGKDKVGYITIAVRSVSIGEVEIPADRYEAFELLALMDAHGSA